MSKPDFKESALPRRRIGIGPHIEPSSIVTKAEVDRLEVLRARPSPAPSLKPKGFDHARADSALSRANEMRLERHKTRLNVAHLSMRIDRLRSVHKGVAKAQFNVKSAASERSITPSRNIEYER